MAIRSVNKPSSGEAERLAMSIQAAAFRLSVSQSFVRLEIARGRLCPLRLGRRVLISEAEIARYLAVNAAND